jgi:hypothetical protein
MVPASAAHPGEISPYMYCHLPFPIQSGHWPKDTCAAVITSIEGGVLLLLLERPIAAMANNSSKSGFILILQVLFSLSLVKKAVPLRPENSGYVFSDPFRFLNPTSLSLRQI